MRKFIQRALLCGGFLAIAASAATIDVTATSVVTVAHDSSLVFYLTSSYGMYAPPDSPVPGQVSIVLGGTPTVLASVALPGTSAGYIPGTLFEASLESLDGSFEIPFSDPAAVRLGLPAGSMVLGNGYRSGGAYTGPVSVLSATAVLSSPEAAGLFDTGEFVVRVRNLGADFAFGYPDCPISTAFSGALGTADGALSVGARLMRVEMWEAPEPGTIGLLLMGLIVIGARLWRRTRATL